MATALLRHETGYVVDPSSTMGIKAVWVINTKTKQPVMSSFMGWDHYSLQDPLAPHCGAHVGPCLVDRAQPKCDWCTLRHALEGDFRHLVFVAESRLLGLLQESEARLVHRGHPTDFVLHVHGPTLAYNLATPANARVVVVRDVRTPASFVLAREARVVYGNVSLVHQPKNALSHTGGRAVSWVEVQNGVVEVRCFDDDNFIECTPENGARMDVKPLEDLPRLVARYTAERAP